MDDEDRYTRITLRIPKDLHQVLSTAADRTSKSLNAEIIGRLQASIPDDTEAKALAVLPERSTIRDDLVDSIAELTALRTEKAIYEMRLDMAAMSGQPVTGLSDLSDRLRFVNLEIARLVDHVERFKAEALKAYGAREKAAPKRGATSPKPKP